MLLEPKIYLNTVKDISIEMLNANNIKGLLLDVDNTLIDFDKNILEGSKQWVKDMKEHDIKLCIVSNSNKVKKVERVAKELEIDNYLYFAKKPLRGGLKKASKLLNLPNENLAVVGDQIFTDVLGANISKMFAILVKPLDEKDIWITKIKRPIERFFIKRYETKVKKENK